MEHNSSNLKRTPLYEEHKAAKGRLIDFGGWELPVQYSGVIDEHKTVRTTVGLFDVSHMGEVVVSGAGAIDFMQKMTTNDASKMKIGQAQYSALLYPNGTLVDDIIVYRRGQDNFFICVNASNASKDFQWLVDHKTPNVNLENQSDEYTQIAVQGPRARELVQSVVDINIQNMEYYHFGEGKVLGTPAIIARTGYTGDLGFELYIPNKIGPKTWQALMEHGQKFGVKPCGLGARDTLRLEVGYLLYGNDMDNTTTALECGLAWITKFDKGDFIGRQTLVEQKQAGLQRKLVGFEMLDKAIGRHGYKIFSAAEGGVEIGIVTSGTFGPSINKNFGMAYVSSKYSPLDSNIWVEIRGERKMAKVAKRPFYTEGTTHK